MAKIATIKEALLICKACNITPFIWGHRGLGKSSLVKQLAEEHMWGCIDLRCSQLEASDIRGLPDRLNGRTVFLPPADLPIGDLEYGDIKTLSGKDENMILHQSRFKNGILFLDEVNRAQDDVLQAIFQLVLDRKVGSYVLPPGWMIVAAGNYMEGYRVSGYDDPAFINRFCHLILSGGETTLDEWVNYITAQHGSFASEVIEFAAQNVKHLDGDISGELGFSIQPSRRSWEMVIKVLRECHVAEGESKYSETAKTEVLAGLVGRELALSYSRYTCPVKPRELIENGVKPYAKKLTKLNRNELTGLMWGMVSFCRPNINDDKVSDVCLDFAAFMISHVQDRDIIVAFCRALVTGEHYDEKRDKTRTAVLSNPRMAQMISKFGKKTGTRTFLEKLTEHLELQKSLVNVIWGDEDIKG